MRYVELRRHTDNDGDKLTEQGVADAEAIGRTGLNPPYAAFVSTGVERVTEMLRILRRAAGQDEIPITTEAGMRSSVEDRWREAAKVAGKGASIEEMRAVDPDLVEHETQLLGSALQIKVGQLLLMTVTFVPPPLSRMSVEVPLLASLVSKNQL